MPVDLYQYDASAPCRTVRLTAKAIGLELNLKPADFQSPEFLKINPQHCVPLIDDNGFILSESRTICRYLVDKYAKDDKLYPKDLEKRTRVNQMLDFDMGTLYVRYLDYFSAIYWLGEEPNPQRLARFEEGMQIFDKMMENRKWAAGGDNLTIADLDLVTTVSSAEILDFDVSKYPNVAKWLANAKKTVQGYEEINHAGCLGYKHFWDKKMKK